MESHEKPVIKRMKRCRRSSEGSTGEIEERFHAEIHFQLQEQERLLSLELKKKEQALSEAKELNDLLEFRLLEQEAGQQQVNF